MAHIQPTIDEIRRLLRAAPPRFNEWYYDKTVEFKNVAREASLAIEAKTPKPAKLEQCLRGLRRWYAE